MAMRLLVSTRVPRKSVAADGIEQFDLPVNPLSVVLITLYPLNNTGTLTDFQRVMGISGAINRASITHRGASVFSMSGRDVVASNYWRHGLIPIDGNAANTNNERRAVTVPLILGRNAFDPTSCFPASRRGELVCDLDLDVADTGYDSFEYEVNTVEILEAEPSEYERKTTLSQTMIVGDNDVQLPIGNDLRGVMCWGTTAFGGATPAPTLGRLSLFANNEQFMFNGLPFEVARTLTVLWGRQPPNEWHSHNVDSGVTTSGPYGEAYGDGWENYCFLDLDPTRDDSYTLKTSDLTGLFLRVAAKTADAARFVTFERMSV